MQTRHGSGRRHIMTQLGVALLALSVIGRAAPVPKRPNILFCIADDASYPHMGAYGCPWVKTPAFDRVAREGLLFTNAYTPNAKCAPSRACILTGRNSWQLEEAANHVPHFPAKFGTFVEALGATGYWTGHTGKGWAPGDAGRVNGEPRQLAGPGFHRHKTTPPAKAMSGNDYSANFRDFLSKKPADAPFCFWYGGFEPHRGYEYKSGATKGGKRTNVIKEVFDFWPDNDVVRNDILDYAFEIDYFDHHLGLILETLEAAGALENTLVVVTSDNGMPFPRCKGQEYEISNHMPMAVMWKGVVVKPGRLIDDFVSFIDLAPTFLDVAGVPPEDHGMQPVTGRSLVEIFQSTKTHRVVPARDHVLIGKERHDVGRPHDWGYPIRGIVKDGYLYLRNFEPNRWPGGNPETGYLNCDGSPTKTEVLRLRRDGTSDVYWQQCFGKRPPEELYHIATDRECVRNLAGDTAHATRKRSMETQLLAELKSQGDPRVFGKGHVFDAYEYAGGSTRNFHERYTGGETVRAGWVNPSDFEKEPIK